LMPGLFHEKSFSVKLGSVIHLLLGGMRAGRTQETPN
jgi:hypothetical protein